MGAGKTFVNKSFPKPFQKTLTGVLAVNGEYQKILIEEQSLSSKISKLKFFERVWENFFPKKFSQLLAPPALSFCLPPPLFSL